MKEKLTCRRPVIWSAALAALLAGLASVSQAHEAVTLYGVIDTGLIHSRIKGDDYKRSRSAMLSGGQNGPRWGLRGSHDIASGLQAIFQLESGFTSNDGLSSQNSRLFGRQSTIGLQSDAWGTLELGRQTSIATKYFSAVDPFGLGFGQANIGVSLSAANTQRYDDMVMYRTPSLGGLEFGVNYSFTADTKKAAETDYSTAGNTRAFGAGLRYLQGPLNLTLTFDQLRPSDKLTSAQRDARPRMMALGATYDFSLLKLAAAYARTTDGWFIGQSLGSGLPARYSRYGASDVFVDGFKANSYVLGVTVPVGLRHAFFGSWQRIDPANDKLTGGDATMNIGSMGYTYDLSKRTNLYVFASYAHNWSFTDDIRSTTAGVGMRHRF